jgi:hypothetical protein
MTDELQTSLFKAFFEALDHEVKSREEKPTRVASEFVPGFFEVPSKDTSCDGCFFKGLVSIGQCPVPRCLGIARADGKSVWFERF